ncbi:MAG: YfhO family protein [Taibaiella sp.]|nr:YfhO family protein [Taibaiella sp.]
MSLNLKEYKQDLIILVGLAVLSLLFCYPQLQGKILSAHDNISWKAMSHEAMSYHEATGKDVLWSNSMFGGMPTYTTYVGTSNTNYVAYVQSVLQAIGKPAYFFFIAMLCFYLLMRVLNVNKWLGAIGAIAYAFSSYNAIIISVGHETKMLTMGYLPAALAGLILIYRERWLVGAALLGVAITLIFTNNHFQVIYYIFGMFACFGVAMLVAAIKGGKLKQFFISSAIAAGTIALGVGPSMPSLLTTAEYAKETMRGGTSELSGHDKKENGGLDKDYAFRWSNGIGETFCLMIPYLYGGSSGEKATRAPKTSEAIGGAAEELPIYWGPQPFISGPVYFGAVVCFLFVLGLLAVKNEHKWWILGASFIFIMLSWGKNFAGVNYALFDTIPYLNKFRTPSMALVIPQFLFPLLGVWAVQYIIENKKNPESWKQIKLAAGITAGLCVLLGVGGSVFFDFTGGSDDRLQPEMVKLLREDRASLAMKSGLGSAAYILAAAALLWAYLKDKLKPTMLFAGLALLVVADLVPISSDYLNSDNYVDASEYDNAFEPREVDRAIMQDPDPYYRVLDLTRDTYNDAVQAYFHKCIGGYHPAKMEIYQDLIDRHMSRNFNGEVLNMLNTKYIIAGPRGGAPRAIPNPLACGNAWFVQNIKWVATADEEMNALNAPELGDTTVMPGSFVARNTAVVRNTFKGQVGDFAPVADSTASVKLSSYGLDDISFSSHNSQPGFAVFSDIYYEKGWKAYVDEKEVPIIRANYVLRALKLPAGDHKIDFRFRPASFYNGKKVAIVSSVLLVLLCAGAFYPALKKKNA